ncbi:MAG: phage terminase large subunit family protein [Deltaproteobacteria bacterium]|nr:phage terminase large subunit family protein [Deltaproteobacteria bacterium]
MPPSNLTYPCDIHRFTLGECEIFKKRERLKGSVWPERYRMVAQGPHQGKWENSFTPYLAEPMDTAADPHIRKIVLCFAPQTGKSQVAFNFLSQQIDEAPGPAMFVMPDEKVTRRRAKRIIIPTLESTPRIRDLMSDKSDDKSSLGIYFKNGASVIFAWATSVSELSAESIQYLIMDEVDKFPVFSGREAGPVYLAEIRTTAYPYTKKILYLSTPTDEEGNITVALTEEADIIKDYQAKCPVCGTFQIMHFDNIAWPQKCTDPKTIIRKRLAEYQCCDCGMFWNDHMRNTAVRKGRWKAREIIKDPVGIGYHLPSWYSPMVSLSTVVAAHLRGLEDPHKQFIFVTQHKAEPFKDVIVKHEAESQFLEKHKTELPPGIVPKDAVGLTLGADTQKHGFWFVVRAWAIDLTSWDILHGYVNKKEDIDMLVYGTEFRIEDSQNTMGIWRAAVDTGGSDTAEDQDWTRTEEIYQWLRKDRGKIFGIKGASHKQLKRVQVRVIDKMKRGKVVIPGGLEIRFLDTDAFKELIFWRLGRWMGKEGEKDIQSQRFYVHADTGIDYVRQLLAEEKRRDPRTKKTKWVKIRRDNHLLDCEVYAAACADPEWMPGLQMIAEMVHNSKESSLPPKQETSPPDTQTPVVRPLKYKRPSWLDQR